MKMDVDTDTRDILNKSETKHNNFESRFYEESDIGYNFSEINPDLVCWSCKNIMNDPYQSEDCGCLLCHGCLTQKYERIKFELISFFVIFI